MEEEHSEVDSQGILARDTVMLRNWYHKLKIIYFQYRSLQYDHILWSGMDQPA